MAHKVPLSVSLIGEKFLVDDLTELGLEQDTNHMKIEFDHAKSAKYFMWKSTSGYLFLWGLMAVCFGVSFISISWIIPVALVGSTFVVIPCLMPCIYYNSTKWAQSRLAAVTDNKLVEKQGSYACCCCCWNEKTKSVPLDKITDLRLEQGWLQRCFDIQAIAVQTASSGGGKAEMILIGLYKPREVRSMVLKVKDNHSLAVLNTDGTISSKGAAGNFNPITSANQVPHQVVDTKGLEEIIVQQHETMIQIKDVLQDMKTALVSMNDKMSGDMNDVQQN